MNTDRGTNINNKETDQDTQWSYLSNHDDSKDSRTSYESRETEKLEKNKDQINVHNINKKVNFQAYLELSLNKKIIVEESISNVKARILFDSEADLTCFRKSLLYRTKSSWIKLNKESVQGFSGHKIEILKKTKIKVEIER